MASKTPRRKERYRTLLRASVVVMTCMDLVGTAALSWWAMQESTGWRIAGPIATVALALLVLCVIPALVLAVANRAPFVAALLAAAPLILALYGHLS
jgi:hypothetical protein